jgi:hypothetical protein
MAILAGGDSFLDVRSWYSRLALLERQICLLERANGQPLGTGFLVGPDLVMTADHVVIPHNSARQPFPDLMARFDFAITPGTGTVTHGTSHAMAPGQWLLASSPPFGTPATAAVDTAVIRLESSAGLSNIDDVGQRGWVELTDGILDVPPNSGLAIMQHPEGGPLKLSLNTQAVLGTDPSTGRLLYRTDTLPGSSGAPCFNADWKFLAMHEGRDVQGGNHNRGVPLAMIKGWLEQLGLWTHVSMRSPVAVRTVTLERLSQLRAETPFAMDHELRLLVSNGEGQLVEFKQGIVANASRAEKRADVRKVLTSVAAFMNSTNGGNVVIGIDDGGRFVGIEREYPLVDPHSANWDGYYRFLTSVLTDKLDVDSAFNFFTVARYHEHDQEICVIHVQPSDRPVFVDDMFYLRVGAQNRPLKGREMLTFAAGRWALVGERPAAATAPALPTAPIAPELPAAAAPEPLLESHHSEETQ